jgi:hypothetical protein
MNADRSRSGAKLYVHSTSLISDETPNVKLRDYPPFRGKYPIAGKT